MTLSSIAIEEKNKLAAASVFLLCLRITIPEQDTLYFVRNNEDIAWNGQIWMASSFDIDEISDLSTGENPQLGLRIPNFLSTSERIVHDYDLHCKNEGFEPVIIDVYLINTRAVAANQFCDPESEYSFELISPSADPLWVTFTLGAPNPWNKRMPLNRVMRNFCRYRRFKMDPRCQYTGDETECDRTLTRCRELGNSIHFGGAPGIGTGGMNLANAS
ncbi:MAG: hypothetical protein CSYNP_01583 [Syntrophus sp. SKADARSKE-3]|nr:hypothetical protein [Syntrophus sp. SKADARSKE-3]